MAESQDVTNFCNSIGPAVDAKVKAATAALQAQLDAANATITTLQAQLAAVPAQPPGGPTVADLQAQLAELEAEVAQDDSDNLAALTKALADATAIPAAGEQTAG